MYLRIYLCLEGFQLKHITKLELNSTTIHYCYMPARLSPEMNYNTVYVLFGHYCKCSSVSSSYVISQMQYPSPLQADDVPHEFTLIHCSQWLEVGEITPSSVLSVINEYERAQQGVDSPAVVMCK